MQSRKVPPQRLRVLNDEPPRADGRYVLYWMTAARRPRWSFALDRAVELARELERPLLVLEALRCGYEHASDRLHAFVLDGMRANAAAFEGRAGVLYRPYVEPEAGAGKGLLGTLSEEACAVVADDWPCFFLPRMLAAARAQVAARLEAVDSCGLLPVRATDRGFARAHDFRRYLQRELPAHLARFPMRDPLARVELEGRVVLPEAVDERWPAPSAALLAAAPEALAELPLDHAVAPCETRGGAEEAERVLAAFLDEDLATYHERRNAVHDDGGSGLSPYLHFGHVSSHRVLERIAAREGWAPDDVGPRTDGKRTGWWNMGEGAEAFLDQLVTWRELGFQLCLQRPDDYARYESLPEWARATLEEHADDERPYVYSRVELEEARTHDELWNAAQRQLRRDGRIHNYLRMLWGKKILHWSASPREAFETMVLLNDRYALDGRDPNSYSGIGWVLGRFDRPWGPKREVFGSVRYMSSANTRRKLHVDEYVRQYSEE